MADPGRIAGPLVIPNTVQCRLIWSLPNGKTVYNVLHGRVAGGFSATAAVAETIFAAIKASGAWTAYKAHLTSGASLVGVDLRDLRSADMPIVESTGLAAAGTGAGTALPPGDALCITLRTAFVGRSNRGRCYLPAFDSGAMAAGGVAAAGTVSDADAFVSEVQAAMAASGLTMGVAQPQRAAYTSAKGTAHSARVAGIQDVTSIAARNNIFDHQRRRAGRS